jgi:acetylornithine deacetylase/succinyl-diaminopimelate desuccinylase-like protein
LFEEVTRLAHQYHPGVVLAPDMVQGFTDCHYFRSAGVPCYSFTPEIFTDEDQDGVHGNDERISLDNLRFGTRFMIELLQGLAGSTR